MPIQVNEFYPALDGCYARGGLQEAERFLLEVTMTEGTEAPVLAAAYNELGSLYRGTSRFARSLDAFEKALELTGNLSGETSGQYATVLNNMAGTYRLSGEQEKAVELFRRAGAIYRGAGMENSYPYASLLNNLSLSYRECGRAQEAIVCLEQALAIIETIPERKQELAITCNNLAALYYAAGDSTRTAACLDRALREFDRCAEEENVHYAAGLNSLASCLFTTGDYPRALSAYQKSAEHTLRFFGANLEYAITCQNMHWVYEKLNRRAEAVDALRQARELYEKFLGPDHERTRWAGQELEKLMGDCCK